MINLNVKPRVLASIVIILMASRWTTAETITSATITADTITALPNCMHYKVVGTCFWWDGWYTETTLYVDQYLPDLVVTVFNKPGDDPWTEVNESLDQVGKVADSTIVNAVTDGDQAGFGQHSMSDLHQQNVFFKEADVIGNPGLAAIDHAIFVSSTATPMMPYFQSLTDSMMWRGIGKVALPEKAAAVGMDITRYIGQGPIRWGGAFPIEGKIHAASDAKAAAVVAQRAVNLLSINDPGHIYQKLSDDCGDGCNADDLHESDDHTQFQMIYPEEQNSCEVLGTQALNYGNGMDAEGRGAYAWIVWRHYRGCIQGEGKYLGYTKLP